MPTSSTSIIRLGPLADMLASRDRSGPEAERAVPPDRGPAPILALGVALAVCLTAVVPLVFMLTATIGDDLDPQEPHGSKTFTLHLWVWGAYLGLASILVLSWWRCLRHHHRLVERSDHDRAAVESLRHAITSWSQAAEAAQSRADELEAFNELMLDREDRIVELKEEVNRLSREAGLTAPYPEVGAESADSNSDVGIEGEDTGTLKWWRVEA